MRAIAASRSSSAVASPERTSAAWPSRSRRARSVIRGSLPKARGASPIAGAPVRVDADAMNLYAIRRRDFWGTPEELEKTAARSAEVGDEMSDDIRWIRSYVVQEESGKLGTVCIYEGSSIEKVREQAERTGMPADEVTLTAAPVIGRPAPVRVWAGRGRRAGPAGRPPPTAAVARPHPRGWGPRSRRA